MVLGDFYGQFNSPIIEVVKILEQSILCGKMAGIKQAVELWKAERRRKIYWLLLCWPSFLGKNWELDFVHVLYKKNVY